MFPLILISNNDQKINKFIADFIAENKFAPYSIFKIHPLKDEITIDQIRSIRKQIITVLPEKRLFIFFSFDSANIEAQNALLKTLEEKTVHNQFIFIAQNEQNILPTIRSRANLIRLKQVDKKLDSGIKEFIKKFAESKGVEFLSEKIITAITKDNAIDLVDHLILHFKDRLQEDAHAAEAIKKAFKIKKLINNNNLNPQLAIDNLLLLIRKQNHLGGVTRPPPR